MFNRDYKPYRLVLSTCFNSCKYAKKNFSMGGGGYPLLTTKTKMSMIFRMNPSLSCITQVVIAVTLFLTSVKYYSCHQEVLT